MGFKLVRSCCAGIDLGSTAHYVGAASEGCDPTVRTFGCFTQDLVSMGSWLSDLGVTDVVMESTGVYWMPVYEALSSFGFDVALVDARAAKALPGRKSDVQDCLWIRELHMYGLVSPCHVPDAQTLALRSYWRQRQRLIQQRSEQILLMQKALEQMNVQLHKVLSDIAGVSGMAIVRAIVAGERDPVVLSSLVHKKVKASPETLRAALVGTWADHHVFALAQALETFEFFGEKLQDCDAHINSKTAEICGAEPLDPPSWTPRKNQPSFDMRKRLIDMLGVDPTVIDGIQAQTAMTLVSEMGPDLSCFPSGKHFASYLGQAPRNKITGGKIRSSRTAKVSSRSATALRLAAQSLSHSNSALGAKFRRLKARIGAPKAITAIARNLAMAYYNLVRHGIMPDDEGAEAYEQRFRAQQAKWLHKQAAKLGMTVLPLPQAAPTQMAPS